MKSKSKWLKEVFGLPTYIPATLALMAMSNGDNLLIVYAGLIPFIIGYNLLFEYVFPESAINGQWNKVVLLILGQIIFWVILLKLMGLY
ncbi:MAG: hypothetical protein HOP23_09750 [Methylococcaceae bacterium]|nr:hypothetical protein [Methylococcaceae bacterium]